MQKSLLDNRYELLGDLGGGGMARVFLARDRVLGRDVAIKMLREQYAEDAEFVERFRREAQSAAALSHPNIVQIYDRGRTEDGRYYIAMEHVPGGTLKETIGRNGPLPARTTAGVGAQIAEALGAAHEGGVIHRDVKPHNVLVTANGDAKVADFGIARAAAETSISRTDAVMGTAAYMAPEQAIGEAATPRSDLYSLGVVLYEMATGGVPFVAESPAAVSFRHVDEEPRPPAELNPEIPQGLNALVLKLLSKDPADRYPDAVALVADLERVGEGRPPLGAGLAKPAQAAHAAGSGGPRRDAEAHSEAAPVAPPIPPPVTAGGARGNARRPRRRKGPVTAAILAALVALLFATGWVLWQTSEEPGIAGALEGVPDRARDALEDIQRSVGTPETAKVPRVEGLELARARQELAESGFDTGVRPRESSAERSGEVLEQSAPAGDKVEKDSKILLAVGEGPGKVEVEVPKLVGDGYSDAKRALEEANLSLAGVEEAPSETVPAGQVISQKPEEASAAKPGTPVHLTVSTGPPESAPESSRAGSGGVGAPGNPQGSYGGADAPAAPSRPSSASATAPSSASAEQPGSTSASAQPSSGSAAASASASPSAQPSSASAPSSVQPSSASAAASASAPAAEAEGELEAAGETEVPPEEIEAEGGLEVEGDAEVPLEE